MHPRRARPRARGSRVGFPRGPTPAATSSSARHAAREPPRPEARAFASRCPTLQHSVRPQHSVRIQSGMRAREEHSDALVGPWGSPSAPAPAPRGVRPTRNRRGTAHPAACLLGGLSVYGRAGGRAAGGAGAHALYGIGGPSFERRREELGR